MSTSDNTTHKQCKLSLCECVCGHVTFKAHCKQSTCKNGGFNNRLTKVSIVGGQTCVCALSGSCWCCYASVVFCVLTVEVDNVVVELIGKKRLRQFSEEHL